jgi:hypothetical protein
VVEGREYPGAAEHLGEFLARTLYATSVHKPRPTTHEASAERLRQIEFFDQNHMHTITGQPSSFPPFLHPQLWLNLTYMCRTRTRTTAHAPHT